MEKKTIRLPVWVLGVRILPLAAALPLGLLVRHWAAWTCTAILALVSLAGVICWLRFRVEYDRNGLQVRSMSVANRRCAYRNLWGIEGKKRLYLDKGSVRLYHGEAWDDFVSTAQRGYQRAHTGKRVPRVYSLRRSRDLFNGNVQQPGEFIFVYVILYLFFFGFLLFLLFGTGTDAGPLVFVAIGMLVIHTVFVVFHVYVGRNADVLPRWIVELCFRPSALTFHKD